MSLYEVNFGTKILLDDDNQFPVDGFMNPHFHNDGETTVVIQDQKIIAGESYQVQLPGCVLKGNFNIKFKKEAGKQNRVTVNYGMVVGLYSNPMTGQIITEENRSAYASPCN